MKTTRFVLLCFSCGVLFWPVDITGQPGVSNCDYNSFVAELFKDNFCMDNSSDWHIQYDDRNICEGVIDPPQSRALPKGTVGKCPKAASTSKGKTCGKKELSTTSTGEEVCVSGKNIQRRNSEDEAMCDLDEEKKEFERVLQKVLLRHINFPLCSDQETDSFVFLGDDIFPTPCSPSYLQSMPPSTFCVKDGVVTDRSTSQECLLPDNIASTIKNELQECSTTSNAGKSIDIHKVLSPCKKNEASPSPKDVVHCLYNDDTIVFGDVRGGICIVSGTASQSKPGDDPQCHPVFERVKVLEELANAAQGYSLDLIPNCPQPLTRSIKTGSKNCFILGAFYLWQPDKISGHMCKRISSANQIRQAWEYCQEDFLTKWRKLLSEQLSASSSGNKRKAEVTLELTGPESKTQRVDLEAPLTTWIQTTMGVPATIDLTQLQGLFDQGTPSAKPRKHDRRRTRVLMRERVTTDSLKHDGRSIVLRKLRQTSTRVSASILVTVRSADVQDRDFPADLQQSLKRNVDQFEGGQFQIDPKSIRAVEVFDEEQKASNQRSGFEVDSQVVVYVLLAALCLLSILLIAVVIRRRQTRVSRNQMRYEVTRGTYHATGTSVTI